MSNNRTGRARRTIARALLLSPLLVLLDAAAASATPCDLATVTWDGGAGTANWHDAANWSGNVVPAAGAHVCVPGTTSVALSTSASVASIEVGGSLAVSGSLDVTDASVVSTLGGGSLSGTLSGAATVRLLGPFTWSGGTMSGTGITAVAPGASLTISSASIKYLQVGRTVANAGTTTWSGGNVYAYGNSVIANSGTFNVAGDLAMFNQYSTGQSWPLLANTGTVRKTAGTGIVSIAIAVDNDGVFDATSGSLSLSGGTTGASSGSFAGTTFASGTFVLDGGSLRTGATIAGGVVQTATIASVEAGHTATLSSGNLGGTGAFTVAGTLTWTGGSMVDGGTTAVATDGTLSIASSGIKYLQVGRTIANAGTTNWSNGNIYAYGNSVIANSGTFNVAGDLAMHNQYSTGQSWPLLANTGTVRKTLGAGGASIAIAVDNDGVFDSLAGPLSLSGTGSGVSTGAFGGTTFNSGTYVLDGGSLRNGATIAGGVVQTATTASIPAGHTATLSSGNLGGTGTFTVAGTLSWTGGAMTDGGTTSVLPDGALTLSSSGVKYLQVGRTLANAGTATWSNGSIYAYGNSVIANSGTFNVAADLAIHNQYSTGQAWPLLSNTGTVRKTIGAGAASIAIAVDNDGVFDSLAGTLSLSGTGSGASTGSFGGTTFNSGTYTLDAGTLRNGANIAGGVVQTATTASVEAGHSATLSSGNLGGAGTFTVAGTLSWTGGAMTDAGTTAVAQGGTLTASSVSVKYLQVGRVLANAGTVGWSAGNVYAYGNTVVTNSGTFTIGGDLAIYNQYSTGQAFPVLRNTGLVRKTGGPGAASIAALVENDGAIESVSGTISLAGGGSGVSAGSFGGTTFNSGTYVLDGGTLTGGTSVAGGIVQVPLGASASVPAGGSASLVSGTVGGAGTFVVDGALSWTGGSMADTGTTLVGAGGTLSLAGTSSKALSTGRTLANAGTTTWSAGFLYGYGNSVIANSGTFAIAGDLTLSDQTSTGQTQARLVNTGTVRKTGGTGSASLQGGIDNDGTFEATAGTGTITLNGTGYGTSAGSFGGTTFASGVYVLDGARLGGGSVLGGATVRVAGAASVPAGESVSLSSGSLAGTGTFTVAGSLTWSGGSMNEAGFTAVADGGTLAMSGTSSKALNGRTLSNAGTVTWSGGLFYGYGSSVLSNAGLFQIAGDLTMSDQTSTGQTPARIANTGTIRKTAGPGSASLQPALDNDGAVESTTGAISLSGGGGSGSATGSFAGTTFSSGTYVLDGARLGDGATVTGATVRVGTTASVPAGATAALVGGAIGGTGELRVEGTLAWSAGSFSEAGTTTVAPGGTLAMSGTSSKSLVAGRTLANAGTTTWSSGTLYGYAGSVITNTGLFQVAGDLTASDQTSSGQAAPSIWNRTGGVLRKTAGPGSSGIQFVVVNDGAIESTSGSISLTGGGGTAAATGSFGGVTFTSGTYRLEGATLRTGAVVNGGRVDVTGVASVPAGESATLAGGTLGGVGRLDVRGTLSWTGGTMADGGTTSVTPGGTLLMSGTSSKTLQANRRLVNAGTTTWSGGNVLAHGGSSMHNSGTFSVAGDLTWSDQSSSEADPVLHNTGTFAKTAGTGTSSIQADVDTPGTVRVATGALAFNGTFANYSGTRRTLTGGTFELTGALRVNADVVTNAARVVLDGPAAALTDLSGNDALRNVTRVAGGGDLVLRNGRSMTLAGPVTNAGRVEVGAGGTLTVTGGYTQTAGDTLVGGTLASNVTAGAGTVRGGGTVAGSLTSTGASVEPDGTLSVTGAYAQGAAAALALDVTDTGADALAVTGDVTLDGALRVRTADGVTPVLDTRYGVVTHATRTGHFASVTGDAGAGQRYVVEHAPASVDLVVRPESATQWGGSVVVANGASHTPTRDVTLTVTAPPSAVSMRISNDTAPTGAYGPLNGSVAWTLAAADGNRTVYVQFRDSAGNESALLADSIVLDRVAPAPSIQTPTSGTGAVVVTFAEDVRGVTTANVLVRVDGTSSALPATLACASAAGATVDCATGAVRLVTLRPSAPFAFGATYRAWVNPAGAATLVADAAGNTAPATSKAFSVGL